ncbi:GNAT family N-acetyltransferase [Amycolatopsis sp. YIM 10]|uniref:GNAT family N-acetyltransferase n=1 Tax=Amycolatopsis sp. YIM 10 TaxID=2653857 RepID=UPI0012903B76|nr:GNAT family N-acetyltransferase [Amycolatopsis sp. YIM 10]QFU91515.1 Mycothiol acetyltransferase [Amycolatopsis sp. YIM 10]
MLIRPAGTGDELGVATVHVRSWQAAYRGLLPDAYLDGLRPEDRAAGYNFGTSDPERIRPIVAVDGDTVRGFAAFGPSRDNTDGTDGELYAIYVHPGHWGGGYGRALITEARRLLAQRYQQAILWVLVGNDQARRFYLADGWADEGTRRTDEMFGVTVDETRFRRTLR